uniref:Uncharacterized protein n=2 Tax=Candidatus Kentrum sp. FM TaxID=2126340 RepID=A0A450S1R9_9GAMM|nr:MAG: hypothetical protein BECKFM1743C_GA0114222_100278 [Candidatus Kentron sp. FM]
MRNTINSDRQFLTKKFPDPPRSSSARLVEAIPILTATLPRSLFQHPGIEQFPVQIQLGQGASLASPKLVDIQQTFHPFYHQLDLPPHSIQCRYGVGRQYSWWDGGKYHHPSCQIQSAFAWCVTVFLRIGTKLATGLLDFPLIAIVDTHPVWVITHHHTELVFGLNIRLRLAKDTALLHLWFWFE